MTILLFANQAQSTLAYAITSTDTTLTVASGTGQYFPQPTTNQSFKLTLVNSTNNLITEIVLVTAVSGDIFTVVRGDEGSIAQAWAAGTFAVNLDTAGTSDSFVQFEQIENGTLNASFANIQTNTGQVISAPVNPTDLVNKYYVDVTIGGSGISGYSGYSGFSGYSGSGISGFSGFSGKSGYSGFSGQSG